MRLPTRKSVPLADVKVYEGNPRHISPEAVEAVRQSIETYGYVQPMLVDRDLVLISGHTRRQALEALGYTQVDVYVAEHLSTEQAQRFRLIDNRTAELNDWAHDKLVAELREFDDSVLAVYFADMDLDVGKAQADVVTDEQVEAGALKAATVTQAPQVHMTGVECPDCRVVFQVKTSTLPGIDQSDLEALTVAQSAGG